MALTGNSSASLSSAIERIRVITASGQDARQEAESAISNLIGPPAIDPANVTAGVSEQRPGGLVGEVHEACDALERTVRAINRAAQRLEDLTRNERSLQQALQNQQLGAVGNSLGTQSMGYSASGRSALENAA